MAGFDWVEWLNHATEVLLAPDEVRRGFLARADLCAVIWKSVKPHPAATESQPVMSVIVRLAQRIRMETGKPDVSGVMEDVERLLEEALAARPFVIDPNATVRVDLTQIDFDALGELFSSGRAATATARLQASLEQRLDRMVQLNPKRIDYLQKLRDLVDRYNAGSKNIEEFFDELKRLADSLSEEEQRHVREQLSEEELAVFDLLTWPDPTLTAAQEATVKAVVRELVAKLNHELLVLDWRHKQATRAAVRVGIETTLDAGLPEVYDRSLFSRKSQDVYQHVFTSYHGDGHSIYNEAA